MIRRYLILMNGLLMVLCLVLAERISHVWREDGEGKGSKVVAEKAVLLPDYRALDNRNAPRNAYQVVVSKDLFRPERTEWKAPVGEKGQEVAKKPAPQITIFGIVIAGDRKQAWIQDPKAAGKLKKISVGETMDGWKVSTIDANVVNLTCGEETKTYRLIEEGKPKNRVVPKAAAPPPAPKPIPHALPAPAPQSPQPPQGGAPARR